MKKCPYCAEKIQDEAIVCRYCGRDIETQISPVHVIIPAKHGNTAFMEILFSFKGRIGRLTYWSTVSVLLVIELVGIFILDSLDKAMKSVTRIDASDFILLVMMILVFFIFWSLLAISVKRWHDRDKSGWWMLIGFVPIIGGLWVTIELGFIEGTKGRNRFGEKTKSNSIMEKIGTVVGIIAIIAFAVILTSSTPTQTLSPIILSTRVPKSTAPVRDNTTCFKWDQVTVEMEGQEVCVYGNALTQTTNTDTRKTYLYFGEKNKFYVISTGSSVMPREGVCFKTKGLVRSNNNILYIQTSNNLSQCDSWMIP